MSSLGRKLSRYLYDYESEIEGSESSYHRFRLKSGRSGLRRRLSDTISTGSSNSVDDVRRRRRGRSCQRRQGGMRVSAVTEVVPELTQAAASAFDVSQAAAGSRAVTPRLVSSGLRFLQEIGMLSPSLSSATVIRRYGYGRSSRR